MKIRPSRTMILLACLWTGVAVALYIDKVGRKHKAIEKSTTIDVTGIQPPLAKHAMDVQILGLPSVIYVGETLSCLVHVENSSQRPQKIRVVYADPWRRSEQAAALSSHGSADIPFLLNVPTSITTATASVSIFSSTDPNKPLCQKTFCFRDGLGDVSDIKVSGQNLKIADDNSNLSAIPVVLVNRYEEEAEYREWAPVKWAVHDVQRRGAMVILSAPEAFETAEAGLPQEWKLLPYDGDPLAAALKLLSHVPKEGPAVVCLAWGFDEATYGVSVRDFQRALDLAIDRLRQRNPAVQLALVTPPPSPATLAGRERYASATRRIAREHHTQLIDLDAKARAEENWNGVYTLDADANLIGMYPGSEGLRQWGEWLKRGIAHNESYAEDRDDRGEKKDFDVTLISNPSEESNLHKAAYDLSADFPGIVTITRTVSRAPPQGSILADILVPADAPRALQASLFLKDKDGLWFQSEPVASLSKGTWQKIRFDLDPCANLLSGRGHAAAWNAYYAGHVTEMGLQFFAPTKWKGTLKVANVRVAEGGESEQTRPLQITNFQCLTKASKAYETTEFSFGLSMPVANPFNLRECKVQAVFRAPSGNEMRVGGFYYQSYCRSLDANGEESVTPDGRGVWRVRFTPLEVGTHEWKLIAKAGEKSIETEWHPLNVQPGNPHGFVRVSEKDPRYFETADGNFFYPIGQNIHAPTDARSAEMMQVPPLPKRGTYAYDDYFAKMAANGENSAIIWMCNWWVSIEWTRGWKGFNGLGDYNLANAWRLDYLLDAAARHGIYVLLVLDNHGKFSGYVDSEWETNPYNAALGGPCRKPEDFFENTRALGFYKHRLSYIASRWGSHPNLLGFEIVSEMNLVGSSAAYRKNPAHVTWLRAVARCLEQADPYHRPITVQYSNDYQSIDPAVASMKELSFIVGDAYKAGGYIVPLIVDTARENGRFNKPTFTAEFGGNWNGSTHMRLHADLHSGLWANCMTNTSGTPFIWWFDFVDRYELYGEYRALANFMRGEDRREWDMKISTPDVPSSNVAIALGAVVLSDSERADFWVYDKLAAQIRPEEKFIQPRSGARLKIEGLQSGTYRIEYWDTADGHVMQTEEVNSDGGSLELQLPTFDLDIAGKIRKLE